MKTVTKLRRRYIKNTELLTELSIPMILKRLYIQRGISHSSELDLNTKNLISYNQLTGINKAVKIIVKAIIEHRCIVVVGDFDVDGVTSIALIILSFRKMGYNLIKFLVPNRFEDHYGLSPKIVERAANLGASIIITVDNGISSYEGVDVAHQRGITVVVIDHHLPGKMLPKADAIINPNLKECNLQLKFLSGVGLTLYFMLAMRAQLIKDNWFRINNIEYPNLAKFLDLVALGTVSDVVPLNTNNRILVHQGILRIRSGSCRPGIIALAKVANIDIKNLCTKDLAFYIGPRLNAAGRLKDMSVGVELMLTDSLDKASIIAEELNKLNQTRREIEKKMEKKALQICHKLTSKKSSMPLGIVIHDEDWHQGVVGILASKIKNRFNLPVIAFAPAGNGILKGSGRSIDGLHMRDLIEKLNILNPGMILTFGGHAMAIGISLTKDQLKPFRQHFTKLINQKLRFFILNNIIWSDGELKSKEISIKTAEIIYKGGPWGQGFPDPLFDGKFLVIKQILIRKQHLKMLLMSINGGPILNAIAFDINKKILPDSKKHAIHIAYQLSINEYQGNRNIQLLIQYIWPLTINKNLKIKANYKCFPILT